MDISGQFGDDIPDLLTNWLRRETEPCVAWRVPAQRTIDNYTLSLANTEDKTSTVYLHLAGLATASEQPLSHLQQSPEGDTPYKSAQVGNAHNVDRKVSEASPEVDLCAEGGVVRILLRGHDSERSRGKERKGLKEIAVRASGSRSRTRYLLRLAIAVAGIPFQTSLLSRQSSGDKYIAEAEKNRPPQHSQLACHVRTPRRGF
jgi:hypothetical protein